MPKKGELTGQQEIFCREYVRCGVATEAYRIAYPPKKEKKKGGETADPDDATRKAQTEWEESSRLMANPNVAARIRAIWDAEAADANLYPDGQHAVQVVQTWWNDRYFTPAVASITKPRFVMTW